MRSVPACQWVSLMTHPCNGVPTRSLLGLQSEANGGHYFGTSLGIGGFWRFSCLATEIICGTLVPRHSLHISLKVYEATHPLPQSL